MPEKKLNRTIMSDGGSEFVAAFFAAVGGRKDPLFESPPYSLRKGETGDCPRLLKKRTNRGYQVILFGSAVCLSLRLSAPTVQQQMLNADDCLGVAELSMLQVCLQFRACQPHHFQVLIVVAGRLHRCQVFCQVDVQLLVAKTRS